MKKFKYTGKLFHAVTLDGKDFIFHEDQVYELNPENEHVKSLIAFGLLKEIAPDQEKEVKPTKKEKI